jgi:hypothetical protein
VTAAPTGWAAEAAASPGLLAASAEVAADAMPDDATHDASAATGGSTSAVAATGPAPTIC